jgi:hypothetical protein
MAFLSQYSGSSDVNRLKLKGGLYLDQVSPPTSNHHIRDFTAQNDHLMISMTDGRVFVAQRLNELLECRSVDTGNLFTPSYDHIIGGDPFPTNLNRVTTAIASYTGSTTDNTRRGAYGVPEKTLYFAQSGNLTVSSGSSNTATGSLSNSIKRFIYSGDDLMYISWNGSVDSLYIYQYNNITGVWDNAVHAYSGTNAPFAGTTTFNLNGIGGASTPEIDPATGDIVMFVTTNNNTDFKITYDHSTNTWNIADINGLDSSFIDASARPGTLSMSGTTMLITAQSYSNGNYLVSTNSGSTWTQIDGATFGSYYFKESGCSNGRFYTINTLGTSGSTYPGILMSTTTPQTVSSWQYESVSEVPSPMYLRNNGTGGCYVSTGYFQSTSNQQSLHAIKKL